MRPKTRPPWVHEMGLHTASQPWGAQAPFQGGLSSGLVLVIGVERAILQEWLTSLSPSYLCSHICSHLSSNTAFSLLFSTLASTSVRSAPCTP